MNRNVVIALSAIGIGLLGLVLAQGMMGQGQNMMGEFGRPLGPGMMGQGMGMMNQHQGMMGDMGMMAVYPPDAAPITEAQARQQFEAFANQFGPEVEVADLMAFSNNYYAQLITASGEGVAEVLVDRFSGAIFLEPGPNMMWNTSYGMRRAFAGRGRLDEPSAVGLANTFLTNFLPGAEVTRAQAFPGYYTFDYGREEVEGMLSVNAFSGEVWVHSWHGAFLGEHEHE
jgi:hypothetical protein